MPVTSYHSANGRIRGQSTGGVRTDYLTDALGSVTGTVDGGGNAQNAYRHKPSGEPLARTGIAADPPFRWVGEGGYRATGLAQAELYVRARHYSSKTGRWTGVDPLWPMESAYGYVRGAVTTTIDPLGLLAYKIGSKNPPENFDPGAGPWNSKPKTLLSKYYKRNLQLFAGVAFGSFMPDAVRNLKRYLDNTGKDLDLDVDRLLRESSQARLARASEFIDAIDFCNSVPPGDYPIVSTKTSSGYANETKNWFYAMNGFFSFGKGRCYCKSRYERCMDMEFYVYDRYNWDGGKSVTLLGITITDKFMAEFQLEGLAREYVLRGQATKSTVCWDVRSKGYVPIPPLKTPSRGRR